MLLALACALLGARPTVLVNHDLYAYSTSLDGGARQSTTTRDFDFAVARLDQNRSELDALGAGFALNVTYGQNIHTWWPGDAGTPHSWLTQRLGPVAATALAPNATDDLLDGRLDGGPHVVARLLSRSDGGYFVASVRMNDHHHVLEAEQLFDGGPISTAHSAPSRRLAAVSPQFMSALARGAVVRGFTGGLGRFSSDVGCTHGTYHLDFSDSIVRSERVQALVDLVGTAPRPDGVELDFTRTPCLFADVATVSQRRAFIESILAPVVAARARQPTHVDLIVKLPFNTDLAQLGFSAGLPSAGAIDVVVLANDLPYQSFQPPPLAQAAALFPTARKYVELYQLLDAQTWSLNGGAPTAFDRTITPQELRSVAEGVMTDLDGGVAPADGVVLFNFHYLDEVNRALPLGSSVRASWSQLVSLAGRRPLPSDPNVWTFARRNVEPSTELLLRPTNPSATLRFVSPGRRHTAGVLTLQLDPPSSNAFTASLNGVALGTLTQVGPSWEFPNDELFDYPPQLLAPWHAGNPMRVATVPASALRPGLNSLTVSAVGSLAGQALSAHVRLFMPGVRVPDAGLPDAGVNPVDAGSGPGDAGVPVSDAGVADGGTSAEDAGVETMDGGGDAMGSDGGAPLRDAGVVDPQPAPTPQPCGCSTGTTPLLAALCWRVVRRRRLGSRSRSRG